jgi:23S rRNA (adenine2503-C2)-methyltransferase
MPINKKWGLAALVDALRAYPLLPRRRITVEYVMLRDVNDSLQDAKRLVRLLSGIPVKVNLLPLNEHERTELRTPDPEQVLRFQETLHRAGMNALIRTARGREIAAACGQLGETVTPPAPA